MEPIKKQIEDLVDKGYEDGGYLVIVNFEVQGTFKTFLEALEFGYLECAKDFIIRRCVKKVITGEN